VALARAAPINHSWGVALHLTARGLATRTLPHDTRSFTIELDFIDHELAIRASDGASGRLPLAPQTVAAFYRTLMSALETMGVGVHIWPVPVEIAEPPIRFDQDTVHASYDREYANRVWRILVQVERVLTEARCGFVGKTSPAHFFWGGFDLALSRFSGRPAP